MHYINIGQFSSCLNFILPIKFHFATSDVAQSHGILWQTTCILSRILTALSNPTEKKFTWNLMLLIVNFPRCSSAFRLFLRIKFTFSYLGLNPIACFLYKNLHFIMYFTHRGHSPDRQQPIRNPLWNLVLFSRSYSGSQYISLGSIGDTTVSLCFSW